MNIQSFLAAVALCTLPLSSQAGIIYEWTATNAGTPEGITFQLEFDRKTVKNGSLILDYVADYADKPAPKRGLLSLVYTHPWQNQLMNYSAKQGGFENPMGWLYMNVHFGADGYLTGDITANDQFQDFRMVSTGREFTVVRADDDGGMRGCGSFHEPRDECGGATGYIAQVTEVPEPGSFALMGIGLLAATRSRRKRGNSTPI